MQEIRQALEEQQQTVTHMIKTIQYISEAARHNAQNAEEAADQAHLSAKAMATLGSSVGKFKVSL